MYDLAAASSGTIVSCATSNDEDFPASNIIDGNDHTFWMTTGLYPQSVTFTFSQTIEFKSIQLICNGIKHVVVEKSSQTHPIDFELISEKAMQNDEKRLQVIDIPLNKPTTARHIKITIMNGYGHFVSIHHFKVEGKGGR